MKLKVSNSFTIIENPLEEALNLLKEVMTYQNDIQGEKSTLFFQMKFSKAKGDMQTYHRSLARIKYLEANEYVCLLKDNKFPTGLLNIALEALKILNAQYELIDLREAPRSSQILRWANTPWELRPYQKEMVAAALKAHRGVLVASVGSGKSRVAAEIIKELAITTLLVVPSRGLSDQLYNDFSNWFGANKVDILDAAKIRKLKKPKAINIVTVQSLASLQKSGEFSEFAKHIELFVGDEFHHGASMSYTSLLKDLDHVYHRFGMTGTFMRNDSKTLELWSILSNVLYEYKASQAIREGYLTPIEVRTCKLRGKASKKYQTEYDNCYSGNPELLEKIAEIVQANYGKQTLILVSKKDKCGHIIYEYLNSLGISSQYISGDNKKEEITATIDAFNDKQFNILIGSSVIGEGINIASTDVMLNCRGGKSEIDLIQCTGRLIRKFPGKEIGLYYDFHFTHTNYMTKHFNERLENIIENFEPLKVSTDY